MPSARTPWTLTRLSVTGITAGAMAWSAWMVGGLSPTGDVSPGRVVSPIEARQREILNDNLGRSGDPGLQRRYHALSVEHFGGRLPDLPVLWEPRLAEVGALARQAFTLEGMFGHVGTRAAILLHPNLAGDEAALARALAHEVVHAYLYAIGQPSATHGPAFRAELQRLATAGAFTGIHADEATRSSLRAWLDDEAKRLDADSLDVRREGEAIETERRALEQAIVEINARAARGLPGPTREEVETLDARREAYTQRIEAANVWAERGRRDLAEFNRQVERYNLMLVYPDGLDEDQIVQPRVASGN